MNKLFYCEMFHSIQGEGSTVGRNVVFLRLSGCTLNCDFCDSKYHIKGKEIDINDVIKFYKKTKAQGIVITGGEPLLQQKALLNLFRQHKFNHIEIETNGTIKPLRELITMWIHFNVSPKLENSQNNKSKRYNIQALKHLSSLRTSIFKFVVIKEDDLKEIESIIKDIEINKSKIYLMAEGATKEDQQNKANEIIELAKKYGYNYGIRLHTLLWNNKRKV